jgi:hypothetical protein
VNRLFGTDLEARRRAIEWIAVRPHIRAVLTFSQYLGPSGFRRGLSCGAYRPTVSLGEITPDGRQLHYGVVLVADEGNDQIAPGQRVEVLMSGMSAELPESMLVPTAEFELREGHRPVAVGHVLEVLPPEPTFAPPS